MPQQFTRRSLRISGTEKAGHYDDRSFSDITCKAPSVLGFDRTERERLGNRHHV